ncbi:MAG: DUF2461 family protein [Angustibacter sp.]
MKKLLDDAIAFYADLEADNSRDFWERERRRYEAAVKPVLRQVLDGVTAFGPWRFYRPHNDVRFGKKPPYKTFAGAVAERPDGVGAFARVSSRGFLLGTGIPMPAPDQLRALRAGIASEPAGSQLADAIVEVADRGAEVFGGRYEPLVRVPAGFDREHPRADLLRWKGLETNQRLADPDWATSDAAAAAVRRMTAVPEPVHAWLARHVGASALSAEERYAPRSRRTSHP